MKKEFKRLYVDDIKPDRSKAFVHKRDKIIYNLGAAHSDSVENFTNIVVEHQQGTIVVIAGRYICIATMGLKEQLEGMLILNLENDEVKLKDVIKGFTNDRLIERVTTAFAAIKNTPDHYYDFELHKGEIPKESE